MPGRRVEALDHRARQRLAHGQRICPRIAAVCDASGNVLVRIQPTISDEEAVIIAEAKRRLASDEPRIPSSEVLARLKRLNDQAKQ